MAEHTPDFRMVGEHFLEFTNTFFNLAKNKNPQHKQVRANSVAFHALVLLNRPDRPAPTMSELAAEMEITKQQLTKLVNDLEEKNLVQRQHDRQNRRQVYLTITPTGTQIICQLKEAMLECTVSGLSCYTPEELAEMDHCLLRLSSLLSRFNPQQTGDMDMKCGGFPQI